MAYWLRCESIEIGQYATIEVHGLRGVTTCVDCVPYLLNLTLFSMDIPIAMAGHEYTLRTVDPQGIEFLTGTLSIPPNIGAPAEIVCSQRKWDISAREIIDTL